MDYPVADRQSICSLLRILGFPPIANSKHVGSRSIKSIFSECELHFHALMKVLRKGVIAAFLGLATGSTIRQTSFEGLLAF